MLSLVTTPNKDKECDLTRYDINKAAQHIAQATQKDSSKK
jgi:hypothetical protein